jgi:ribonuclease P protein subunit POP4
MKGLMKMEFIGLNCEIVLSLNRAQIGLKGKIIDETMKNIILKTAGGVKTIAKKGAVFRIKVKDKKYDIDGNFLIVRPEDRIKKDVKKW